MTRHGGGEFVQEFQIHQSQHTHVGVHTLTFLQKIITLFTDRRDRNFLSFFFLPFFFTYWYFTVLLFNNPIWRRTTTFLLFYFQSSLSPFPLIIRMRRSSCIGGWTNLYRSDWRGRFLPPGIPCIHLPSFVSPILFLCCKLFYPIPSL